MIRRDGETASIEGAMTISGATQLLAEGLEAIKASRSRIDLAGVTAVDSSALAVVFGWVRTAQSMGRTLLILNPPKNLLSLATVYGVAELIPLG